MKNKDIELHSEIETDKVLENLSQDFKVVSIEEKKKSKKAKPPFITSTMQQDA